MGLKDQEVTSLNDPPEERVRLADTSRVEAFSDGVLAIVITLLVLDLRPPEVPRGQLLRGLADQWPSYLAYFTSFHYVGVVWLNHHATFQRINLIDAPVHWANLGILFTAALLPFPTAVLSRALVAESLADARTAVGLYALVGMLLYVSWFVFFQYLTRRPQLTDENVEPEFFRKERFRVAIGVVLYPAAGVLGVVATPILGLVIFLLLTVFFGLTTQGFNERPYLQRRAAAR